MEAYRFVREGAVDGIQYVTVLDSGDNPVEYEITLEHANERYRLWLILADGITWYDADGREEWPYEEAVTLSAMLEGMGYETELQVA